MSPAPCRCRSKSHNIVWKEQQSGQGQPGDAAAAVISPGNGTGEGAQEGGGEAAQEGGSQTRPRARRRMALHDSQACLWRSIYRFLRAAHTVLASQVSPESTAKLPAVLRHTKLQGVSSQSPADPTAGGRAGGPAR